MRRIRLRTGPTAIFGAVFVLALIVWLPMRLALAWFGLGDAGLTAQSVRGSIWLGTLHNARFGDIELGDLSASLSPVQLLIGRARVDFTGQGGPDALHGAVSSSRHSIGIDDMTAHVPVGSVFAPVPVSQLALDDVSVHFEGGSCAQAEGRVRATLAGSVGATILPQSMSGTARCEGNLLLLPLTSQADTEALALRLHPDGRYRAELTVRPTDPAAAQKLELSGFQQTAGGYVLALEGHF